MALALKPAPAPHRDVTGGIGVDRIGMAWVNAINAAEAAYAASAVAGVFTGWRVKDWGDGLFASGSVLGTHGFTSGVGYATAAASWTAAQGTANSFSNCLAHFTMAEIVDGIATGRELSVQRGSSSSSAGERFLNIMETPTPCTGLVSATSPRATGGNQRFIYGTAFGAAGASWTTTAINWIGSSATMCSEPWVAEKAVNGRVGFGVLMWGSSAPTYETGFLTLPLVDAATTDPYPWVTMCGEWRDIFGGAPSLYTTSPTTFAGTSANMHALDSSGTWRFASGAFVGLADAVNRPGAIATTILADKDGCFWLLPVIVSVDNVTGSQTQPKGVVCDVFKVALVANSTHRWPTTLHSSVLDATEQARVLLGQVALISEVGYVPTWTTSTNQTTWKSFGNDPVAVVPDTDPPTVDLVDPPEDGEDVLLEADETVTVDIGDETEVAYYAIFAIYETLGMRELVLESEDLALETSYTITPSTVDGKLRYEFVRTGGWPAPVRIRTRVIDTAGNVV